MNHKNIVVLLLMAILPGMVVAQKKKKGFKKPAIEFPVEDPRITKMIEATQRVIIVDSIVVPKKEFLDNYHVGSEIGALVPYNQFFHTQENPLDIVCVNDLGNKCYFSKDGQLYTSDFLGGEWDTPVTPEGLEGFEQTGYPFMMADGTTFYFAAVGGDGIGGLDIYCTRYDNESGRFLKAENIGMPFNSEANDYMYVIDEDVNIGYFATDRRQPQDSVCIYTFIPTESRKTYDVEGMNPALLRSLARIDCIANTWGDGKDRRDAIARKGRLKTQIATARKQDSSTAMFVVNDNIVYRHATDFRNPDNKVRFSELLQMRDSYQKLSASLEKARRYYATASSNERKQLNDEILHNEQLKLKTQNDIRQLEKDIRREELKMLVP